MEIQYFFKIIWKIQKLNCLKFKILLQIKAKIKKKKVQQLKLFKIKTMHSRKMKMKQILIHFIQLLEEKIYKMDK